MYEELMAVYERAYFLGMTCLRENLTQPDRTSARDSNCPRFINNFNLLQWNGFKENIQRGNTSKRFHILR